MARLTWIFVVASLMLCHRAEAVQLRWSTGASNLSFTGSRVCTLLVNTGAAEPLPGSWHLIWVSRGSSQPAMAVTSESSAPADTALLCSLYLPSNPIDQATSEQAAAFCANSGSPHLARYVFDVEGGTAAKFQLVAFRPVTGDTAAFAVVRSAEATLNGGLSASYPPVIHRASLVHTGQRFDVQVIGSGLSGVNTGSLYGPDLSWSLGLQVVTQTDSTLLVRGYTVGPLPSSVLELHTPSNRAASLALPAEPIASPLVSCTPSPWVPPDPNYKPKDFALLYQPSQIHSKFHLFYIRTNKTIPGDALANEKSLGTPPPTICALGRKWIPRHSESDRITGTICMSGHRLSSRRTRSTTCSTPACRW